MAVVHQGTDGRVLLAAVLLSGAHLAVLAAYAGALAIRLIPLKARR
jgi:hypothetical protein